MVSFTSYLMRTRSLGLRRLRAAGGTAGLPFFRALRAAWKAALVALLTPCTTALHSQPLLVHLKERREQQTPAAKLSTVLILSHSQLLRRRPKSIPKLYYTAVQISSPGMVTDSVMPLTDT